MLLKTADDIGLEIEVMVDGGIRSEQDLMRAPAPHRPRLHFLALGAGGQVGVARAIQIICKELDVTMVLTGVKKVEEIGRRVLVS